MNYDLYFPTPIWWEQTNIDTVPLLNLCRKLHAEDATGRRLSNEGGWQSMDFRPDVHAELAPLANLIMQQSQQCVRDFGYREDTGFIIIENFWFNINTKGNSNAVHIHDNSFLSGTFYVDATEDQGRITFYKNHALDYITSSYGIINQYTPISASAISYAPNTGKLIMFPGHLPHGVTHNPTDRERISIAFNVKLIRTDDERYRPTNT